MSSGDFVARLMHALAESLGDLAEALSNVDGLQALVAALGESMASSADLQSILAALGPVPEDLEQLATAAAALDLNASPSQLLAQAEAIGSALQHTVADLEQLSTQQPPTSLPAPFSDPAFWGRFGGDVVAYLAQSAVRRNLPKLLTLLQLLGAADLGTTDSEGAITAPPQILWANLGQLIANPAALLRQSYSWGGTFDHQRLIEAMHELSGAFGLPADLQAPVGSIPDAYWASSSDPTTDPRLNVLTLLRVPLVTLSVASPPAAGTTAPFMAAAELAVGVLPIPDATKAGPPVGVVVYLEVDGEVPLSFSPTASVTVELDGQFDTGLRVELRPSGTTVTAGSDTQLAVTVAVTPATPWVIGDRGGTRVETKSIKGRLSAQLSQVAGQTNSDVQLELSASFAAYLELGAGDSFIQSVLGTSAQSVVLDAGVAWSSQAGLRLSAGIDHTGGHPAPAGGTPGAPLLHIDLPVNLDLAGVVQVDTVTIEGAAITGGAATRLLASGSLSLGPLSIEVDGIGIEARLLTTQGGNLGPADFAFAFAPPRGLGMAIDAPMVSGGGYLATNPDLGQYMGAIAVSVGTISVQGVGVLSTKLPNGGWSLVVLGEVTGLSVQLGFGIELTGIGVLVGINRTINVPGLQALARAGALDDLMFPADLAANAPRVAKELDTTFPSSEGQFVLGPTVRLVWGSGSLIQADLAIYVELPAPIRIAVLGSLQITVPSSAAPVLNLHLDVLGVIDLAAKTISLDLSLNHSTLAGMPLTGQAALRAGWGSNPSFIMAIGGFNKNFLPPTGFPSLDRLALSYTKSGFQLRLSAYQALTSNTFQLGSEIDVKITADPVGLTATASFDALVQFKPFALELDVAIYAAITFDGAPVLALSVAVHLTGPSPWQISGKVQFKVLFWSFTVPIAATFGGSAAAVGPSVVDVVGPLVEAVADRANWTATLPAGPAVVQLRDAQGVHPLGSLSLRQRVAPLEQRIDRSGADVLGAPTVISVTVPTLQATSAANGVVDMFAPAQFITMSDAQKLSAPSFEPMISGLTMGSGQLLVPATSSGGNPPAVVSTPVSNDAAFDVVVVDVPTAGGADLAVSAQRGLVSSAPSGATLSVDLLQSQRAGAAAARHTMTAGLYRYALSSGSDAPVAVGPQNPWYSVTSLDMTTQTGVYPSRAEAHANAGPQAQVVRQSELVT